MTLDMPTLFNTFKTSKATGEGLGSDPQQAIIWNDVGTGIVPIGGLIAWLKTFVNGTPAQELIPNYVECNGQVLADGASPFDGMTIPDLNGDNRFLRGNSTSGATSGTEQHNHIWMQADDGDYTIGLKGDTLISSSGSYDINGNKEEWETNSSGDLDSRYGEYTSMHDTKPPYMDVVWIMRIY